MSERGDPVTLTPEEFRAQMQAIVDEEAGIGRTHSDADDLMAKALRSLGYGEGVDIYQAIGRWFS